MLVQERLANHPGKAIQIAGVGIHHRRRSPRRSHRALDHDGYANGELLKFTDCPTQFAPLRSSAQECSRSGLSGTPSRDRSPASSPPGERLARTPRLAPSTPRTPPQSPQPESKESSPSRHSPRSPAFPP